MRREVDDLSERASDADREQTVLALREHLLAGRLTLDEFSERVELAYRAQVGRELARVQAELPVPVRARRKATRVTAALFAHVVRRGRLRLRAWTWAVAAFSDVDLDLREAEIESPRTVVNVLAGFGNVDVYVPEGVDVDVAGIAVFGHRREWGRDVARRDAPLIDIRVLGLFGTVDVWRVPHALHGDYDEIIAGLRDGQR